MTEEQWIQERADRALPVPQENVATALPSSNDDTANPLE
jgi:hypothetical protein